MSMNWIRNLFGGGGGGGSSGASVPRKPGISIGYNRENAPNWLRPSTDRLAALVKYYQAKASDYQAGWNRWWGSQWNYQKTMTNGQQPPYGFQQHGSQGMALLRRAEQSPYERWGIGPYGTNWQQGSNLNRPPVGSGLYMTQDEYIRRQNARRRAGWPYIGVSQQEWILRQNAAPMGYTWTPYAGYVPTPQPQATTPTYPTGNNYGYGYGYPSYGEPEPAELPSWYANFLNQMYWRI